jgi:DNA-binding XRE family transcriptional regulator
MELDRAGLYDPLWTAKPRSRPRAAGSIPPHDVYDVAEGQAGTEGGAVPDASPFLRSLGHALRERREELKLTQEAISLRTGVPQRRIWEIEAGIGNPTARTLLRLISGLNVPCSRLFARAEELAATSPASEEGDR